MGAVVELPLFQELKRRRVIRALVAYAVASFAVLQIVEPVMHGLHWPDAVLSWVVVALAAGFPVVVAVAWIFDVDASGIQRVAPAARWRGLRLSLLLLGLGGLAAAPGLAWYFLVRAPRPHASAPGSAPVIAVLPFASLSPGEENRYFADAVHIELLGQLAKVGDLKVISRTSVLQYRDGARNLREIGEALGVSSVLEGSVQRAAGRVRIQAQLIDAKTDRQIWADHYDRDLTDLFQIQTAVAEEITRALHKRLSADERSRIARKPTGNAEAYALYLRAIEYADRSGANLSNLGSAERLLRNALELDPRFALAHARLSRLHATLYWFNRDHTRARLALAREEADRALALQPDLAEAHTALGFIHYWGDRDYQSALREFDIARKEAPENIEFIGYVQRRKGHFDEAIASLEEALRLDPRSTRIYFESLNTLTLARRYAQAWPLLDRYLRLAPDLPGSSYTKARLSLIARGDVAPAREFIRLLARRDPAAEDAAMGPELAVFNPADALLALGLTPDFSATPARYWPKALVLGLVRERLRDPKARADFEAARGMLEKAVAQEPEEGPPRAALGMAYAHLGRKAEALREARRAVELVPLSRDAVAGPVLLEQLAAVEAQVGEAGAAVDHLAQLLAIPSYVSVPALRVDPLWDPLRGHPRFAELIR